MTVWDKNILFSFMLMLTGAVGQRVFIPLPVVNYPPPVCAVRGSTVTLHCTFTPVQSIKDGGREDQIEIIRVRWCKNHEICQGETPSVYDSSSLINDPRYRYLGDKTGTCTLQITDIQKEDGATFRFRMVANDERGDFTERSGVTVTVSDRTQMKIDAELRGGETPVLTLYCTAPCTFHQLEVTWFRDDHALSQSGHALQLHHLTAKDSGNYTCALKANVSTRSAPFTLHVEAGEGTNRGTADKLLAVRLVLFTLHTVLIVIVPSIVIKRTWQGESSCCSRKLKRETEQPPDFVHQL